MRKNLAKLEKEKLNNHWISLNFTKIYLKNNDSFGGESP